MRFRNLRLNKQKQRDVIKFVKNMLKIDNVIIIFILKNIKND